ncbi:MAG: hypothetical protein LBR72_06505 [Oscillospiraceae bacterium]|jgi:hypothetical protein|nr:hypothetical protein [Oscillospiraceae bacterium]
MEISALFENVDSAEAALVNLQALGIFPERYKIRSLRDLGGPGEPGGFVTTNGIFATPVVSRMEVGDDSGREEQSEEVQLLLTIGREDSAARVQSALISNHGRRVRTVNR